jgi:hypothetical protein
MAGLASPSLFQSQVSFATNNFSAYDLQQMTAAPTSATTTGQSNLITTTTQQLNATTGSAQWPGGSWVQPSVTPQPYNGPPNNGYYDYFPYLQPVAPYDQAPARLPNRAPSLPNQVPLEFVRPTETKKAPTKPADPPRKRGALIIPL